MTDITEQDRRVAHEWAASLDPNMSCWSARERAAARVILATVDAPEPTLAEELRDTARWWREGAPTWEQCCDRFDALATRADRVERDLAEARAEVERLTAELETETVALEENVAADQQANTQGTLSGALPNPADVPEGQAWIVEYHGDDLPALRRLDHPGDWYLVRKNGTGGHVRSQDITLVSRLVPAPRQITTREELDGLPRRTVIRDKDGVVCERTSLGEVWYSPESTTDQTHYITFPATVLWTPEETA